jgi:hypothetical protein
MKSPPPSQNAERRLGVPRQYEVIDTPPEDIVVNSTAPAAPICAASTLLILLADKNRPRCQPEPAASKKARDFSRGSHGIRFSSLFP